jgi:peptidoglycan/LPS O-acetylase OafA/YrhL
MEPPISLATSPGRSVGLDIVRSIAILLVLLSHCGVGFAGWYGAHFPDLLAQGGFWGVVLFFVLSGFLIGRILITILEEGPTSRALLVFLIRRWVRTLPLYFVWLLVLVLVWPPQWWAPDHHAILLHDLPWFLTLTQNLAWPMVDTWFEVSWSLTVEEWFYLLFAAFLFATAWFSRRAALPVAILLFMLVPPLLRWRLPETVDWDRVTSEVVIYRLDAFALGIIVAWISLRSAWLARWSVPLLILGLAIIALQWSGWSDRLLNPTLHIRRTVIFNVASLGCALCLPAALAFRLPPRSWPVIAARALSQQSYAIYIMHLSLIYLATFYRTTWHIPRSAAAAATLVAIYGLSYFSTHFFELKLLAVRPPQCQPVHRQRVGSY